MGGQSHLRALPPHDQALAAVLERISLKVIFWGRGAGIDMPHQSAVLGLAQMAPIG